MNSTTKALCVISIMLPLIGGCGSRDDNATSVHQRRPDRQAGTVTHSPSNMGSFLVTGMTTNGIIAVLGEPDWTQDLGSSDAVWHYEFPPFPAEGEPGVRVIGASVFITNGCLARWDYSHEMSLAGSAPRTQNVLHAAAAASGKECNMSFFVVSATPIPGGRQVDTTRFPKLGYIAEVPSLVLRSVQEIVLDESAASERPTSTSDRWEFRIQLTEEDGKRLRAFTEANISRQALTMLDDEPVFAAVIRAPIEGAFVIECRDPELARLVKAKLVGTAWRDR